MSLAEPTEQNSSEKFDDNKDVRISTVRDSKITIITASALLAGGKLSTALTKMTLQEDRQDMRVKNV